MRKQAEQALRESESKFRTYIEYAPLGVFVTNSEGRYIDCNPAAAELFDYDMDALFGMHINDIFFPEDSDMALRDFQELRKVGRLQREYRVRKRDGTPIWIMLRAAVISEGRTLAFCKDITERKEAERALRASESRYRLLAENMADVIWTMDAGTLHFEYVSPSVQRLQGYTVEEVLTRSFAEIMTPASYATLERAISQRLATFLAGDSSARTWTEEVELRRKDGSTVWAEIVTTLLKGNDGAVKVLGVSRDVSQRRGVLEALRESEERFRSIAEQMADVLFVTAPNGVINYISPSSSEIFGWTPEEMVGQNFTRYLVSSEIPRAMAKFKTDIEEGQPAHDLELLMKRKDGRTFYGDLSASARRKDGRTADVIGLIRDISERKQAEQAIRESEARYRAIVEDQTELITRWLPDSTLTFVNEAFCRFIGKSREELLGRPFLLDVAPEDRETVQQHIAQFKADQFLQSMEQRIVRAHGDVRWVQWTERALCDETGRVLEIQSVGRDVTERKEMDVKLQTRSNELEGLFALSSALNMAQTESVMLPAILAEVNRTLGADASIISLYDPETQLFNVALATGELAPNVGRTLKSRIPGAMQALLGGQPYLIEDISQHESYRGNVLAGIDHLGPAVIAPMQSQDQFLGVISAMRKVGSPGFDGSAIRLFAVGGEMVGNALHRVRLHDRALLRLQYLQVLQRIGEVVSSSFDLALTLPLLVTEITAQTKVDAAAIFLLNPHTLQLEYAAGQGFKFRRVEKVRFRPGEGLAGRAVLERKIVSINTNLAAELDGKAQAAQYIKAEAFDSYDAVPLIVKGQVKGVLELFSHTPLPSDPEWLDFLKTLAHQTAIAIDNVELFEGLQRSNLDLGVAYDATIEGWSRAMDLRDRDTEGHTQRVTAMTERLARAFGMSEPEIVHVRRGALLHDIGKMGVPDAILHKPGKLTDEEWKIMRMHPQYAYDMLWPIPYLRSALDIPYCHHEKWDGTGYPRGLKGEEIPLAARVFAVVDVWDALINDRPYRAAWPADWVYSYIRSEAGTHFDPRIVEAFFKINPDGSE